MGRRATGARETKCRIRQSVGRKMDEGSLEFFLSRDDFLLRERKKEEKTSKKQEALYFVIWRFYLVLDWIFIFDHLKAKSLQLKENIVIGIVKGMQFVFCDISFPQKGFECFKIQSLSSNTVELNLLIS